MNCPFRSLEIRPAFSRIERCFEIEGFEILKRSAISPAVRSVAARYAGWVFNDKLREWEDYYNYHRPHGALDR